MYFLTPFVSVWKPKLCGKEESNFSNGSPIIQKTLLNDGRDIVLEINSLPSCFKHSTNKDATLLTE